MKICDNGVIRDMTAEEIEAIANIPEPNSEQENITDEEAMAILLGGVG